MKRTVLCLLAFLLGGSMLLAQLPTGAILGVVKDSTGAVVPGATVTATATDTGQTRTVTSGNDGAYRFDGLPIGNYSITVAASGFQKSVQSGLNLTVGQELVSNVTLQVGQATQTVSVTTAAPVVNTTTTTLSSLVNSQQVANLPLNGRNYTSLTLIQPGVNENNTTSGSLLDFGFAGVSFSANGAPTTANSYLLDGAILNNAMDQNAASATGTTLGIDGIQEYTVLTNAFPAQYGLKMGSETIIVSKSGTNQFHGDAFEFLRNSALDSRNDFDLQPSVSGHRLPPFKRSQFGGSLGGPIQKDKTFFFGVYEGLRAELGTTNVDVTLPTGCQGGPNAVITVAACPEIAPSTSVTILPQVVPFLSLYPAPNLPSNKYGFVYNQDTVEDYAQLRLDHTFSAKDSGFGRWTFDQSSEPSPFYFNDTYTVDAARDQFITLAWTHIYTSNLLHTARASYSKAPVGVVDHAINPLLYTTPYIMGVNTQNEMGLIVIGGLTDIGSNQAAPRISNGTIFTASDDVDWNRGNHSMKFGGMFNHFENHMLFRGYEKDRDTFANLAAFMQGNIEIMSGILPVSNFIRYYHYDTIDLYAADEWRVMPRLTVNYGIRYEPSTTYKDMHGLDSSLRNPLTDTAFTVGPYFKDPSYRNWGPRVGFAWDLFGNGSTALKGGFGVLYDQTDWGNPMALSAGVDPPFANQYTLQNLAFVVPLPQPAIGTFPTVAAYMNWHMNQPHMLSYNLTMEHQLPSAVGLQIAFAGSKGINLMSGGDNNLTVPTGVPAHTSSGQLYCATPPAGYLASNPNDTPGIWNDQFESGGTSCYLPNSPRRNLNFGSLSGFNSGADSVFNALQVTATKHATRGLQLQANYTFSRMIQSYSGLAVEPQSYESSRGPGTTDVTDQFHLNGIYHLPNFTDSKGVVSKFENGWWLSSIVSINSGSPFDTTVSGIRTLSYQDDTTGTAADSPDVLPGRKNANITHGVSAGCGTGPTRAAGGTAIAAGTPLHTKDLFFDPCAFTAPAQGFVGNEGSNFLRGPGYDDWDASVVKDTAVGFLGEGGEVEFRGEFFNLINHPNFLLPGTSVAAGTCGGSIYACGAAPNGSGGIITATAGTSRQIQFGLKVEF